MSRRIKLIVAYDGSNFSGWQLQKNDRTVQGELEAALEVLHNNFIRVTGAGRTDSGVHALGQVCHFDSVSSIPSGKFTPALNSLLPRDVRVLSSCEVDGDFHSRHSARKRTYLYRIKETASPLPFDRNYVHILRKVPGLSALNECARILVGKHDFTTFAQAGDASVSREREIFSSSFYMERGFIIYKIEGTAFLWKMVRSLVGTMLEISRLENPGNEFRRILTAKDRSLAGTTAPPGGLYFYKVEYE